MDNKSKNVLKVKKFLKNDDTYLIFWIRHGYSFGNHLKESNHPLKSNIKSTIPDIYLTEIGYQKTLRTGDFINRLDKKIVNNIYDKIYASNLLRTIETGLGVKESCPKLFKTVTPVPFINEIKNHQIYATKFDNEINKKYLKKKLDIQNRDYKSVQFNDNFYKKKIVGDKESNKYNFRNFVFPNIRKNMKDKKIVCIISHSGTIEDNTKIVPNNSSIVVQPVKIDSNNNFCYKKSFTLKNGHSKKYYLKNINKKDENNCFKKINLMKKFNYFN